ncbi:hypothetical protein GCM10010346_13020 [Streptomyces chryseus]|uniref:Uncharacterized protein n=1 Tax=Streptomyces chryseus TaxID=68186 RepID=A0ABQ3DIX0_9ACTN|nr:hypothetical protein [Streptomyces chryseus]GHA91559.1 hypothetical protein GCM10010346_13020 [Streptomyces chryseus]
MTLQYTPVGDGRRRLVPPPSVTAESVPHPSDPPLFRALLRQWHSKGRTLPGRRDPEWVRLVASPAWPDTARLSASRDPRDGGR